MEISRKWCQLQHLMSMSEECLIKLIRHIGSITRALLEKRLILQLGTIFTLMGISSTLTEVAITGQLMIEKSSSQFSSGQCMTQDWLLPRESFQPNIREIWMTWWDTSWIKKTTVTAIDAIEERARGAKSDTDVYLILIIVGFCLN